MRETIEAAIKKHLHHEPTTLSAITDEIELSLHSSEWWEQELWSAVETACEGIAVHLRSQGFSGDRAWGECPCCGKKRTWSANPEYELMWDSCAIQRRGICECGRRVRLDLW